ncbi:beta-lactamase family protein [Iamia sp. SCSIO 61187]|uniref:serine hydrolase domain-containing protein n=1 Tax=Iamia sp. SCSIO 61187 TaxID=2722752 RepID=UPI001C6349F1|nr:serine hydrolase domain-containing protein [Iamia sp. SCSIO 61187]QYG92938.1 beta-lactamase family protein [Iamia sp. SCSIO 61187]
MTVPIDGWVDPRFAAVREAFVGNFTDRGEVGGAVHVVHRGEVVVDLVGGWADEERTRPWTHDTIVDVYSVGKAILAVLALQLVDDGVLALDQPVAEVWPDFAAGGKAGATVEHALTHRAGVPAIREPLTDADLFSWATMTAALAATETWWVPGERLAYHTNTFGHLVGEIVHRATGQMPGERLRAVTGPLGADVWFGVPDAEQHRCADIIWDPGSPLPPLDSFSGLEGDLLMNALSLFNPPGYSSIGLVNTPAWRAAEIGSTSGHASASGIARLYAALLEPHRLLSPTLLARATAPRVTARCPILGDEVTYGVGFQPTTARRPLGPNGRSFGHYGSGGALGFADPDAGIAFGYAMNHLIPRWQSTRNRALIEAVYASLA